MLIDTTWWILDVKMMEVTWLLLLVGEVMLKSCLDHTVM